MNKRNVTISAINKVANHSRKMALLVLILLSLVSAPLAHAGELIPITIEKGITLIHLTRQYCTSEYHWKELAKINNLKPPYLIIAGDTLYAPIELVKTEMVTARVASVIGGVYVLEDGKQLKRLHKGDTILPGQTLVTEEDGFAHLIFPDNKYTRISSNSKFTLTYLIRLVDKSLKAEFFLEKGRITHSVKKKLKANETFTTRTPVSVTGVRGTEFRVKVGLDNTNIVETLKGEVQLSGEGGTVGIKAGEGIKVEKGKELLKPVKLPPPPPLLKVEDVYRELPVIFPTVVDEDVDRFRLRITEDAQGNNTVLEKTATPGQDLVLLALPDGEYFGFLTSINKESFESAPSSPFKLYLRTIPGPPIFKSPLNGKAIFQPDIKTDWLDQEVAANYFIQLATDQFFTNVVNDAVQKGTTYRATNLDPGKYYLRVQSIAADGFRSLFSLVDSWEIRKTPTLSNFQGSWEGGVDLKWASMGEGIVYDLQLSGNKEFTKVLKDVQGLPTSAYAISDKLEPGTYYIRVRGVLSDGQQSPWTPYQILKVPQPSFSVRDGAVLAGFLSLFLL